MVSTGKKKQLNRRILSQLDDFDRDFVIGNTANERQENTVINERTNGRDFTVRSSSDKLGTNENTMKVKALERRFNETIDRERRNFNDTVEDRIQNALLTAIDSIVAPKIELAIRSLNASSGQDATSLKANSERGEYAGFIASFGSASANNNVLHV